MENKLHEPVNIKEKILKEAAKRDSDKSYTSTKHAKPKKVAITKAPEVSTTSELMSNNTPKTIIVTPPTAPREPNDAKAKKETDKQAVSIKCGNLLLGERRATMAEGRILRSACTEDYKWIMI